MVITASLPSNKATAEIAMTARKPVIKVAHCQGDIWRKCIIKSRRPAISRAGDGEVQTVPTGVAGEPTAPGSRSGGAVRRNRLRLLARSQSASSERYQISPR